jgi:hypothetical protein
MKFCRKQGEGCSKPEDFHDVSEVLNLEEGVWEYCFRLENRLGQKSEILCKEMRVSGTKPTINITINTPAISTDLPVLDFPAITLNYKVQVDHNLATKSELQKHQMCRVEFSFHGQVNLATDTVTCLSTECRGLSLKDFTACGSEVEIDISGVYKNNLIDKAYLKLIVRSEDGAGNASINENSVLIDKDRWEYVPLTGPGTSLADEKLKAFFPITDDRVHIVTERNTILEYFADSQTWKEILDVSQYATKFLKFQELVVMPDQSIYALWHYGYEDKRALILRRKPGKPWENLDGDQSPPYCTSLTRDLAGHLYCQNEDKNLAYSYTNEIWKEISLTDSEGKPLCTHEVFHKQRDSMGLLQPRTLFTTNT